MFQLHFACSLFAVQRRGCWGVPAGLHAWTSERVQGVCSSACTLRLCLRHHM